MPIASSSEHKPITALSYAPYLVDIPDGIEKLSRLQRHNAGP